MTSHMQHQHYSHMSESFSNVALMGECESSYAISLIAYGDAKCCIGRVFCCNQLNSWKCSAVLPKDNRPRGDRSRHARWPVAVVVVSL